MRQLCQHQRYRKWFCLRRSTSSHRCRSGVRVAPLCAAHRTNAESTVCNRRTALQAGLTLLTTLSCASRARADDLDDLLGLPVGKPAPEFSLPAVNYGKGAKQKTVGLDDLKGKWVVLYFYPADFTGGCSIEARNFQRDYAQYKRLGAEIVGVSTDDVNSHQKFCDKLKLEFPLLADDGSVSKLYKSLAYEARGDFRGYSARNTFLIDPQGLLRAQWISANPVLHSTQVLDTIRSIQRDQTA